MAGSRRSRVPPAGTQVRAHFCEPIPFLETGRFSEPRSLDARLQVVQLGIATVAADQLIMTAVLDDAAAFNGDDTIGVAYRGQPVGNDEDRAAGGDFFHVLLDGALAFVIERAGRLIEDQNAGVRHQGAGDRNALALTARKAAATLANDGVIA